MMVMNLGLPQPAPALADSLDVIIAGLCQAMADQSGIDRFIAPICVILWARLLGVSARFQALFKRWRKGRLPAGRPQASRPRRKRPAAASEPKPALPRGFAWLLKFVPQASVYRVQLQNLLTDPEMAAFLAAAPQAGRLLRPLCHTLGVKPIPKMLRAQNAKPGTPDPEGASPSDPSTAEKAAKQAQPDIAKKVNPAASSSQAGDPRWASPVSLSNQPPRPRQ